MSFLKEVKRAVLLEVQNLLTAQVGNPKNIQIEAAREESQARQIDARHSEFAEVDCLTHSHKETLESF